LSDWRFTLDLPDDLLQSPVVLAIPQSGPEKTAVSTMVALWSDGSADLRIHTHAESGEPALIGHVVIDHSFSSLPPHHITLLTCSTRTVALYAYVPGCISTTMAVIARAQPLGASGDGPLGQVSSEVLYLDRAPHFARDCDCLLDPNSVVPGSTLRWCRYLSSHALSVGHASLPVSAAEVVRFSFEPSGIMSNTWLLRDLWLIVASYCAEAPQAQFLEHKCVVPPDDARQAESRIAATRIFACKEYDFRSHRSVAMTVAPDGTAICATVVDGRLHLLWDCRHSVVQTVQILFADAAIRKKRWRIELVLDCDRRCALLSVAWPELTFSEFNLLSIRLPDRFFVKRR
jgi:hypothetical protein